MPTKPTTDPTWATDTNYTNAPNAGLPTKVAPSAGKRAEGFRPTERPPAEEFNHVLNAHGAWLSYLADMDWLTWQPIHAPHWTPDTLDVAWPSAMGVRRGQTHPFADDVLVATTSLGILSSIDGIQWRKRTPSASFVGSVHPKSVFWSSVASLWIAGGSSGSTDEIITAPSAAGTWTARNDPASATERNAIAENGTTIVIARSAGGFLSSTNGTTWTERTHPAAVKDVKGVAWGNGVFVAAGALEGSPFTCVVLTSPDGVTWTDRTANIPPALANALFRDITFDAATGLFFVIGGSGSVMTSADGVTWTNRSITSGGALVSVVSDGSGNVYALNGPGKHLFRTKDAGLTWTGQTLPFLQQAAGVTIGAGRLIAFGESYTADAVGIGLGLRSSVQ